MPKIDQNLLVRRHFLISIFFRFCRRRSSKKQSATIEGKIEIALAANYEVFTKSIGLPGNNFNCLRVFSIPLIEFEPGLFSVCIVSITDKRQLCIFFVPSQSLILPFSTQQRDG